MKSRYISFAIGALFLIMSFVVKDAVDINFQDTYYVIEYALIFKLLALSAFFVSIILTFKHKNTDK